MLFRKIEDAGSVLSAHDSYVPYFFFFFKTSFCIINVRNALKRLLLWMIFKTSNLQERVDGVEERVDGVEGRSCTLFIGLIRAEKIGFCCLCLCN